MVRRYCFIAETGWEKQVKNHFRNIDVTIEKLSDDEGCVTLNNENQRDDFLARKDSLAELSGISQPIFVPAWKTIVNNGPYITDENYVTHPKLFKNKRTGKFVQLGVQGEQAFFSHNKDHKSQIYHQRFKSEFTRVTGLNFDEIETVIDRPQPFQAGDEALAHRYVTLDGNQVLLVTFATPPTSVDSSGYIIPGIHKRDVVLNSDKPVRDFKSIFVPGASWIAKWNTPRSKGRIFLDFRDEEALEDADYEDLRIQSSEESDQSDSDKTISDYQATTESYSSSESEEGEEEDLYIPPRYGTKVGPLARVPFGKGRMEDITTSDKPDFENLTEDERLLLPMSYVLSQSAQWRIILDAIMSNFTNISELPKVNDFTLDLIADSIMFSMTKGVKPSPAAIALLRYAEKRHV